MKRAVGEGKVSEVEVHTNGDSAGAPVRRHDVQAKTPVAGSGCPLQRTLRVKQRWQALCFDGKRMSTARERATACALTSLEPTEASQPLLASS